MVLLLVWDPAGAQQLYCLEVFGIFFRCLLFEPINIELYFLPFLYICTLEILNCTVKISFVLPTIEMYVKKMNKIYVKYPNSAFCEI